MVENYVGIETVIAKIIRDLGEQGNYRYSSIKEWVAEVIQKISYKGTMVRGYAVIDINNHRAEQPCNLIRTIAITYKGCRLRYGQDVRHHISNRNTPLITNNTISHPDISRYFASNYDLFYKYDVEGKLQQTIANTEWINNMYNVPANSIPQDYYYYIEADWYKFNIESGQVEVDYMALYTDANSFPYIPDNTYLLEAIQYYVMMKLLGTGYTHPVWTGERGYLQLKQLFEEQFERAKGSIYFPSKDEMDSYSYAYNKLVSNINHNDYYKNSVEGRSNENKTAR